MAEDRTFTVRPFPPHSLEQALAVPKAIQDQNNGRPMNRILLANAMGRTPGSSEFRQLLSSSVKYGLTTGNEKSETIALTELGTSAVRPRGGAERAKALRQAALHPDLFGRLYDHYNNGKLPQGDFFRNVLERDYNVPPDRCEECAAMLVANGLLAGIVKELQGTTYVLLAEGLDNDRASQGDPTEIEEEAPHQLEATAPVSPPTSNQPPRERFIFVAHGKNKKPLEQLKSVLNQFGIPYKVASDEPQIARPISDKVAQTMRDCHSAILIFTGDEESKNAAGDPVFRPNENVIFELGAASVLYENRIVIFKEDGVEFPSDFRDIGYISFEKDRLDAKGADLIKELIALRLVKVQAA